MPHEVPEGYATSSRIFCYDQIDFLCALYTSLKTNLDLIIRNKPTNRQIEICRDENEKIFATMKAAYDTLSNTEIPSVINVYISKAEGILADILAALRVREEQRHIFM